MKQEKHALEILGRMIQKQLDVFSNIWMHMEAAV